VIGIFYKDWDVVLIMKKWIWVLVIAVLVIILFYSGRVEKVANFEECVAAGNPVMESYPRQCRHGGKTFVEVVEAWRLDGVVLMRHESEGWFGCYGCGKTLCVDPVVGMEVVEETAERYCSSEFEVVE
jgi:hypothetical protein